MTDLERAALTAAIKWRKTLLRCFQGFDPFMEKPAYDAAAAALDALIAAETPKDPMAELRAAWDATQHTGPTPEACERLKSAIAAFEAERRKK